MIFDADDFCVSTYYCDANDDGKKGRFCLFMFILALVSIAVLSCTVILEAEDNEASTFKVGGINYEELSDKTVRVIRDVYSGDIVIPSTVKYCDKCYSVVSIGSSAFQNCNSLFSVIIPDCVTSLRRDVFCNCTSLSSVTIGNGVISLDDHTFKGCKSLSSVIIGGGITSISNLLFKDCKSLTSVSIGNGVTSINDNLFEDYKSLTSVSIGDNVASIGKSAFQNCISLESVTIGNSVRTIGDNAFCECTSLTSIYFNAADCSDLSGGNHVFSKAGASGTGIRVVFEDAVTRIPAYLFYSNRASDSPNITSVTVGINVKSIGVHAFEGCTSMIVMTISDSVGSIGEYAFCDCGSLKSVTVGRDITSIGCRAFCGCTSLKDIDFNSADCRDLSRCNDVFSKAGTSGAGIKVVFGDTVTRIPAYLFYAGKSSYSPNISSITIGNSVGSIGEYAFSDCGSLKSVTIGSGVQSIGYHAFYGCTSLTGIDFNAADSSNFSRCNDVFSKAGTSGAGIKVVFGNTVMKIPAHIFHTDSSSDSPKITSVTISNSVRSIGNSAFSGCTSLASATIGSSVASIGSSAFRECTSLASMMIPDSVTFFGEGIFYGCIALKSVTIGNGVEIISNGAFMGCRSLTSVTIPDTVKIIRWVAFKDCTSLTSVTIGKGVESIGNSAFSGCTELANVSILRTESVIKICDQTFFGCKKLQNIYVPNVKYDDYLNAVCWSMLKDCLKPAAEVSAADVFECNGLLQTCTGSRDDANTVINFTVKDVSDHIEKAVLKSASSIQYPIICICGEKIIISMW